MNQRQPLPPGSIIGILGGGQLGRMTAMAAARLGYHCHIYCQAADEPAAQVTARTTVAAFDDRPALGMFAKSCDVVTLEFENVPLSAIDEVAQHVPVRPGRRALEVAQDRLIEKDFVRNSNIATAEYRAVGGAAELAQACRELGGHVIAKTRRLGYDGKGQIRLQPGDDVAAGWTSLASDQVIAEAVVDFACEISVIVARDVTGATASYVPVENHHVGGILDRTVAPADVGGKIAAAAIRTAETLAVALDFIGVLAVEMFIASDGEILVNEIAPRPHNSGHWTIDACAVSQFEQLVRAVTGLPLGDPARHSNAVMQNLVGDAVDEWPQLAAAENACLHLYGKSETRPGRKMGHVTYVQPIG